MPFGKKKSAPAIRWAYGCKAPHENIDLVREQIRKAHRYRNVLIAIYRRACLQFQAAVRTLSKDVDELTTSLTAQKEERDRLRDEMKANSAKARKRVKDPVRTVRLTELKASIKETSIALKAAKQLVYQTGELKAAQEEIEASKVRWKKRARKVSGLYWGTYINIEASVEAAQSSKKGIPLDFKSFRGDGSVGVQFQNGIDPSMLTTRGGKQLMYIRMPDKDATSGPRADGTPNDPLEPRFRRGGKTTIAELWFRIGSDGRGGRTPIWAKTMVYMSRPFPEGCRVKCAQLFVRLDGTNESWSVQFVLGRESGWAKPDNATHGQVGVDIGWRLKDNGIRVAYWYGDDGREGELVLPLSELEGARRRQALHGARDALFNEIRDEFADWLDTPTCRVPLWLSEQVSHLRQWKSHGRLTRLILHWVDHRFDGDEVIFTKMASWRRWDRRELNSVMGGARKFQARRKDIFRCFAAMLRREYKTIIVEDWNVAMSMKNAEPEEESGFGPKHYARLASCGLLRELVTEAATESIAAPAAGTTAVCVACGQPSGKLDPVTELLNPASLQHKCGNCGEIYDQDRNAAIWLSRGGVPVEPELVEV